MKESIEIFFTQMKEAIENLSVEDGARFDEENDGRLHVLYAGTKVVQVPSLYTPINLPSRGRCYDHNFLRFSTIFGEKMAVFLKNQCYDKNFA
jgi:hypothetical protein